MALLDCYECTKPVSDQATACPHCGAPALGTTNNADWRIDTLTTIAEPWSNPWTGEVVPVGTLIKKVTVAKLSRSQSISITIPNASALLLNIARRAYMVALETRRKYIYSKKRETELHLAEQVAFEYLEHMFEAVICSHTAVEAYVNELLRADRLYERVNRHGECESLSKDEIERRASLTEKVGKFLPEALGKKSPKGIHRAYSDLQALTKIRDRLIHLKSADRKSSGPDIDTIWHRLLTCDSPVDQAMVVIKYFAPGGDAMPRWLSKMPKR